MKHTTVKWVRKAGTYQHLLQASCTISSLPIMHCNRKWSGKGRGTNKQTKKNKEKSFIKTRHDCLSPGWQHHRHTQWPLMKLVNHHTKCVSWSTFTVKYFFVSRMYNFFSQLPSIEWKCRHESSNGDWKTKACKRQTTQYQYFFAFAYMDPDCDLWRFVTVQFPLRPIILRQIVELIQNPQIESIL